MQRESLQGLHIMMVHNPEEIIRRVAAMQRAEKRWHKLIVHGEKADWITRMPAGTFWDIRNVDISEETLTAENAERLGRQHAEVHGRTLANFKAAGIDPWRLAFEGRNEPQPAEQPFVAAYEVARIKRAEELGVPRLVVCNWSVGQPMTYGGRPDTACNWEPYEPIRRALRPGDLLGLHQYYGIGGPWEAWPDGNPRWIDEGGRHLQCPWDAPILITEGGVDDGVNGRPKTGWFGIGAKTLDEAAAYYVDMICWADAQYMADGRIVGVVLFTSDFENREWFKFDMMESFIWEPYFKYLQAGQNFAFWGDERTARWRPLVEQWAAKYNVDPRIVATLIALESGGDPHKLSAGGVCVGLMQLPCREAGYGRYPERSVLLHPSRNVQRGCALLAECLTAYPNDTAAALNAYFVGPEAAKAGKQATYRLVQFRETWEEVWPDAPCPVTSGAITKPSAPVTPPAPAAPTAPTDETVRQVAWASLYPAGGLSYVPAAALQKYGGKMGLAQPLTREVRFTAAGKVDASGPYILQGYDGAPGMILWCRHGEWDKVQAMRWQ